VPADGALRALMAALRHGTSIGLLIDQHTHERDGGRLGQLFGLSAGIRVRLRACRASETAIIFAWSRPLKDGRYRIEPGELFPA
jgi:lauroyl/myristoyl acyltransferase